MKTPRQILFGDGGHLLAQRSFLCTTCGAPAGEIRLYQRESGAVVERDSFTSESAGPVDEGRLEQLRGAIECGDPGGLYEFDQELAPFFCPTCRACYCGAHYSPRPEWDEEGFFDCTRGRCPQGHERMLED